MFTVSALGSFLSMALCTVKCRALLRRKHSGKNGIHPRYQRKVVIAERAQRQAAHSLASYLALCLLFIGIQIITAVFFL